MSPHRQHGFVATLLWLLPVTPSAFICRFCCSWGLAIGAGMSLAGSGIASSGSSSAARRQAASSLEQTRLTNEANERLFRLARGSEGSAVLPEYMSDREQELANAIFGVWDESMDADRAPLRDLGGEAMARNIPLIENGDEIMRRILTGEFGAERTAAAEDTQAGRQRGLQQGIQEATAALRARREAGGLGGGSSFENQLMLGATIPARAEMASMGARDRQRLLDENMALQLEVADAPFQRTAAAYDMAGMPLMFDQMQDAQRYQAVDELMRRLGMFNIGPGQPIPAQRAETPFVPNSAMMWGQGLTQAGNALSGWLQNRPAQQPQPMQSSSIAPGTFAPWGGG